MKKIFLCLVCCFLLFSCETVNEAAETPEPIQVEQVVVVPEPEPEPPKPVVQVVPQPKQETKKPEPKPEDIVVATFGDVTITKKDYIDTKLEVELVVKELNKITENSDYDAWLGYLSDEYRERYSDKAVLKDISKRLSGKGLAFNAINLNTLHDYFKYIFVPSRKNIRVDDIVFTSAMAVNVMMNVTRTERRYVYTLERQKNGWKIVDRQS